MFELAGKIGKFYYEESEYDLNTVLEGDKDTKELLKETFKVLRIVRITTTCWVH